MKFITWEKSESVNSDGRLVFWEIIETFDSNPIFGEVLEVANRFSEIYERLRDQGLYEIYSNIEFENKGYMESDPEYYIVGQRVENDNEYMLRMKQEEEKRNNDLTLQEKKQKVKEEKERKMLQKLREKYKE